MGAIGIFEFISILVIYPVMAMFMAVMIGIGIALGFRWGRQVAAENYLQRSRI